MNIDQNGISVNWDPKGMGRRIRFVRGSLSQSAFAEKLGITQADVSRYERGKRSPPLEILLAMAQIGDVSIDFLVRGDTIGPRQTLENAAFYDRVTETLWVGNLPKPVQILLRTLVKRLAESDTLPSPS